MGKFDEIAFIDATEQAELVRKKQVTPIELVDTAIERIERLNPTINAVITTVFEQARESAISKLPEGPFTGVPFLLKDLTASLAGVRTTEGSAFVGDYVPDFDSELVKRFKRAGLVIMGKTNTPEFGLAVTTEPYLFGPTKNPWDTSRTTGGSSGGSAAAVAAGLVPMAHGNDGGGSIRIPSSCCGLFGLKPTRGRNPLGREYGDIISGIVAEHVLTRSVRDSAALLDATTGNEPGDPYWAPPMTRPFLQEVGADPSRLRIALSTIAITGGYVHADCISAVHDAAKLCTDLGHEVEEVSLPISAELYILALASIWTSGCAYSIDHWARKLGRQPTPDKIETATWTLYEMGRQQTASQYLLAVEAAQLVSRDMSEFLLSYDILMTPTLNEPPVPIGYFAPAPDDPMQGWLRSGDFSAFTTICNLTGQPAMSVPLTCNVDGLPIGTQFIGRFGDEATLFRLAAQLEEVRPWTGYRPPISA